MKNRSHPCMRILMPVLLLLFMLPVLIICAVAMPPLWILSPGLLLAAVLIFFGSDHKSNIEPRGR